MLPDGARGGRCPTQPPAALCSFLHRRTCGRVAPPLQGRREMASGPRCWWSLCPGLRGTGLAGSHLRGSFCHRPPRRRGWKAPPAHGVAAIGRLQAATCPGAPAGTAVLRCCSELNGAPSEVYPRTDPWNLWIQPYLEKGSLQV